MAMDAAADLKCYAHYRDAAGVCPTCQRGLCSECLGNGSDGHCADCVARARGATEITALRREARIALRRAGVSVPHQSGDPVFLRAGGHPLLAGISLAVAILLAMGLGAATTVAEIHWGVPRAAVAPALGIVVGTCVAGVFGGTSRIAGVVAVLLYALAVVSGPEALGIVSSGVNLPGPGQAAQWLADHHAVALACYAVAAPLAYIAAAGRRLG